MKKAFTLIELMIVVMIFGIIAAIFIPSVKIAIAKHRAKNSPSQPTMILEKQDNGTIVTNTTYEKKVVVSLTDEEKERQKYNVTKMFEVNGVYFYKATWKNEWDGDVTIVFAIESNGITITQIR